MSYKLRLRNRRFAVRVRFTRCDGSTERMDVFSRKCDRCEVEMITEDPDIGYQDWENCYVLCKGCVRDFIFRFKTKQRPMVLVNDLTESAQELILGYEDVSELNANDIFTATVKEYA